MNNIKKEKYSQEQCENDAYDYVNFETNKDKKTITFFAKYRESPIKLSPTTEAGKCFFTTNCFDRVDDDYYYCDVCRKKKELDDEMKTKI